MNILALNAGSSSLKYRLFRITHDTEELMHEGESERLDSQTLLASAETAITECLPLGIDAIGHRVVHGGSQFFEPTPITPNALDDLRKLSDLDPLHNPTEVALIETTLRVLPNIPTVAVFDTAFHRTLPKFASQYALPWELSERLQLRRYGFHGISHRYVSERLIDCLGRDSKGTKLITCHLGSGASLCAILDGKSVDTSMGLTPLEGLVMGTRSGDIDPGLMLYLLRTQNMTADALDDILNHQSGLRGLSGRSNDVRDLEQAASEGDARSELALAIFAYRIRKYIGAYAAALGGLDAIAFTGGIGEHSAQMRTRICQGLEFLGIVLDEQSNGTSTKHDPAQINMTDGRIAVWVIPTDEERQIAREVSAALQTTNLKHS